MDENLLLPYALNSLNEITHIDNAHKGEKYNCPTCGSELVLRISKIPKGQKYHRRNHFAHKGNSDNHCSESFLHLLFKQRCTDFLIEKIERKDNLNFKWKCEQCHEEHRGNLLQKAVKVISEYHLGICKPDIALLDEHNNVLIVIEIIVTHKPEVTTLHYYKANNITCLQILVEDFSDCDHIEEFLSSPFNVNICRNPKCEICGKVMNNSKMKIVQSSCRKCNQDIKVAMIVSNNHILTPDDFSSEEIEMAQALGANINVRYSKTINNSYNANICSHCNAFIGDNYVHHYDGLQVCNEVDLDYKCLHCLHKESELKNQLYKENELRKAEQVRLMKNSDEIRECPKCGGTLKIRSSYRGYFWGCSNYPNCKHTEDFIFE